MSGNQKQEASTRAAESIDLDKFLCSSLDDLVKYQKNANEFKVSANIRGTRGRGKQSRFVSIKKAKFMGPFRQLGGWRGGGTSHNNMNEQSFGDRYSQLYRGTQDSFMLRRGARGFQFPRLNNSVMPGMATVVPMKTPGMRRGLALRPSGFLNNRTAYPVFPKRTNDAPYPKFARNRPLSNMKITGGFNDRALLQSRLAGRKLVPNNFGSVKTWKKLPPNTAGPDVIPFRKSSFSFMDEGPLATPLMSTSKIGKNPSVKSPIKGMGMPGFPRTRFMRTTVSPTAMKNIIKRFFPGARIQNANMSLNRRVMKNRMNNEESLKPLFCWIRPIRGIRRKGLTSSFTPKKMNNIRRLNAANKSGGAEEDSSTLWVPKCSIPSNSPASYAGVYEGTNSECLHDDMMSKIKIVASLDKIPPPMAIQKQTVMANENYLWNGGCSSGHTVPRSSAKAFH